MFGMCIIWWVLLHATCLLLASTVFACSLTGDLRSTTGLMRQLLDATKNKVTATGCRVIGITSTKLPELQGPRSAAGTRCFSLMRGRRKVTLILFPIFSLQASVHSSLDTAATKLPVMIALHTTLVRLCLLRNTERLEVVNWPKGRNGQKLIAEGRSTVSCSVPELRYSWGWFYLCFIDRFKMTHLCCSLCTKNTHIHLVAEECTPSEGSCVFTLQVSSILSHSTYSLTFDSQT